MNVRPVIKLVIGITLVALPLIIGIPNYIRARTTSDPPPCTVNLETIAEAKKRWAEENVKAPGSMPLESDLLPYLPHAHWPVCTLGGKYDIGPIGSDPSCSLTNELPWHPRPL